MSLFSDKFFKSNETTFPLSDTIALPSHQNIGWTQHRADALIGLVAMAWGSSYLLMKEGLGTIPPFSLIALRFLIAFFAVSLLFREKIKQTKPRTLLRGSILGLFLFGLFAFLIHGMQTTSTSNAGFLTSTTVVLVPVFHALITRRLPNRPIVIGTLLTMTGIGFMTLQQSMTLHSGDVLCLIGAVVYAFHILLTADFTKKEDGLLLGIWQLGFAGLYGLICTMLFETPTLPAAPSQWMAVLGLALICSAFGFVAQPMAQKYTTPEHTGLLFSLEPLFSALFAFLFLQETLSAKGYFGAALMMAGVLVASASPEKKAAQTAQN